MGYTEISCETAMNQLKRRMPYSWDLNIYRGCEHGCKYCYAMYSHDYLGSEDYFGNIFIKTNIVEQLEKQLYNPNWKREIVNIGGVTDSYQAAEGHYRLMPIIPYLTDSFENFDLLFSKAKDSDVHYVLPGTLYLRGKSRTVFFDFIRKEFPHLYNDLAALYNEVVKSSAASLKRTEVCNFSTIEKLQPLRYKTGGADKEYKNSLYNMVNELRDKYKLSSSYTKPMKEKLR